MVSWLFHKAFVRTPLLGGSYVLMLPFALVALNWSFGIYTSLKRVAFRTKALTVTAASLGVTLLACRVPPNLPMPKYTNTVVVLPTVLITRRPSPS